MKPDVKIWNRILPRDWLGRHLSLICIISIHTQHCCCKACNVVLHYNWQITHSITLKWRRHVANNNAEYWLNKVERGGGQGFPIELRELLIGKKGGKSCFSQQINFILFSSKMKSLFSGVGVILNNFRVGE